MNLVAKTLYGLEKVLSDELISFGASNVQSLNRAVKFTGDKNLLYKVNYCSRTALSVLMPVAEFRIRTKDDLYKAGIKVEWSKFMDENNTFSIVPVINSPLFTHTGYAGLILKDAIADYFRNISGKRPSVNAANPDILINLHVSNDQVNISLDSSVNPLFKRGYRQEQAVAPLNEVLAAGILQLSGWNSNATLTDPMCGSGTFSIEAGMMACNIPSGKLRKFWGFQRWKDYDKVLFEEIITECNSKITTSPVQIMASDISEDAVQQTRSNLERAGLSEVVTVKKADFKDLKASAEGGFVFLNPPYGERINPEEIDLLYGMVGTTLKHNFPGTTAWLITSNRESLKKVGLKPKQKMILFNGALECTLLKYEMYQGSKKTDQH
jgi:putative N6-adenine-specific DNA methylase